jgi:hypothetical protein
LAKQFREIKELHEKHDTFHFYKKLKEITNSFKRASISKFAKKNKISINPQEI